MVVKIGNTNVNGFLHQVTRCPQILCPYTKSIVPMPPSQRRRRPQFSRPFADLLKREKILLIAVRYVDDHLFSKNRSIKKKRSGAYLPVRLMYLDHRRPKREMW